MVARSSGPFSAEAEPVAGIELIRIPSDLGSRIASTHGKHLVEKAVRFAVSPRVKPRDHGDLESAVGVSSPTGGSAKLEATISLGARAAMDGTWVVRSLWRLRPLRHREYDVVFSSFGPFASVWLGWAIQRRGRRPWVVDFRDLIVQDVYPAPVRSFLRWHERRMVRSASAVTAVSNGLVEALQPDLRVNDGGAAVHLVRNGFEPSIEDGRRSASPKDGVLRIGYTGNMYSGRRDARALFQALRFAIDSREMMADKVEVHYAGSDGTEFRRQASVSGVASLVIDHGAVSKNDALALQARCDILLALSWNSMSQKGIVTGKVFEYMQCGSPIVAITGGDLPGAELSALVRELELGFAFEYADQTQSISQLAAYVGSLASIKGSGGDVSLRNGELLRRFEFERIVEDLEVILASAVHGSVANA